MAEASKVFKVSYQGVPGAYSEMAILQMFAGHEVNCVPHETFEQAFQSVQNTETDFALLPFENTLGGSIHLNYDLSLRFNLTVIGELQFRVRHCLLVLPGVKISDIKRVTSHPQALAQCEGYIRRNKWESEAAYDTAGSAMKIKADGLRDTASIASQRVAELYNLEILEMGIVDDTNNYTRFLLLTRDHFTPQNSRHAESSDALTDPSAEVADVNPAAQKYKTSIVFTLQDTKGVLFKALSCFALRDIDLLKIESRPNVSAVQAGMIAKAYGKCGDPELGNRIAHVAFYVDFLASTTEKRTVSALRSLEEIAPFMRVLGCYPANKPGANPPALSLPFLLPPANSQQLKRAPSLPRPHEGDELRIAIVGFGTFGQFLAKEFRRRHTVLASSRTDYTAVASALGVQFFRSEAEMMAQNPDIVVFCVSIISFQSVLKAFPQETLKKKLVVDVLSVKDHPKQLLQEQLPPDSDILCTHPMFGPESAKARGGWNSFPLVYEKVRVKDNHRCVRFLDIFQQAGCRMVPMACEEHDRYAAGSQFITHLTGRTLFEVGNLEHPHQHDGIRYLAQAHGNHVQG